MMIGEQYAREMNSAVFAPACGTVAKEVVRKHFEIPACNTCLVTEESPGLKAAGFVDMDNCVLANEHDVVDKVRFLLGRPDELQRISKAGHRLVHTRHGSQHRDQLYQWFVLNKQLRPSQRIEQLDPFARLFISDEDDTRPSAYIISNGSHLRLMREGELSLATGDYEAAREYHFLACLSLMGMFPEARLKLAVCQLHLGDSGSALKQLNELVRYTLIRYGAAWPDPVEWAYFIIALICAGRSREAQRRARQFPHLHHARTGSCSAALSTC